VQQRYRLSDWDKRLVDKVLDFFSSLFEKKPVAAKPRVKFVGYHELLRLLKEPGCPVCRTTEQSLRHYVSIAFVEELTTPEFRLPMRESLGFCERHSRLVRDFAKGRIRKIGVAIVYEDLIHHAQKLLNLSVAPLPKECLLCDLESEVESYIVSLISDYGDDNEFEEHYQKSDGCCLHHLRRLIGCTEGSARSFFLSDHRGKLRTMLTNLAELIRKNDYRFAEEKMTQAEISSWKMAVHFVVGGMEFVDGSRS
jgi:hypothetical protein